MTTRPEISPCKKPPPSLSPPMLAVASTKTSNRVGWRRRKKPPDIWMKVVPSRMSLSAIEPMTSIANDCAGNSKVWVSEWIFSVSVSPVPSNSMK